MDLWGGLYSFNAVHSQGIWRSECRRFMIGRWGSRLTFDGTKKGFGMTGLHELFIISTWRFHELYMTRYVTHQITLKQANAFLAHPSTHQKSVSHEFFVGITHLPQLIFVYWNSPYPLTAPVDPSVGPGFVLHNCTGSYQLIQKRHTQLPQTTLTVFDGTHIPQKKHQVA